MPHNLQLPSDDTHSDPDTDYFGAWDGILERHFYLRSIRHTLEFSQTRVLSGFLPLLFLATRCYSRIDSSFLRFADFFECIFKTRVESGFRERSTNRTTANSMEQKIRVFFQINVQEFLLWFSTVPSYSLWLYKPVSIERDWLSAADTEDKGGKMWCTQFETQFCVWILADFPLSVGPQPPGPLHSVNGWTKAEFMNVQLRWGFWA